MNKPRKWWVAGLMTLVRLGLGQLYNGQLNKAILFVLIEYCFVSLMFYVAFISVIAFLSLAVIGAICYIFVLLDAILVAKKNSTDYLPKKFNNIYVYAAIVIALSTINYFYIDYVKNNIIESFKFSSSSMSPTILNGDRIIVDRSVSARSPKRGDIVIFEYPENPEKNFLKRVVAIGGDNVELRNSALYVNGNVVVEPYVKQPDSNENITNSRENYGPAVVPNNSYFVLGDNRDNSQDSRYFGFISHDKIKGTVRSIYWSWDKSNHMIRWDRIGMQIQ